MDIDDVVFPARLAFGMSGGPERQVDVVALASGREHRNARQSRARRRYRLPANRRPLTEMRELSQFFEARGGALRGFLFNDPLGHSTAVEGAVTATDVVIGTGDGTMTEFQLTLGDGRMVTRPKSETVRLAVNGNEVATGAFTTNGQTGVVSLSEAPPPGASVTAGFDYFVPVRFENTVLTITTAAKDTGEHEDIFLVEVLE